MQLQSIFRLFECCKKIINPAYLANVFILFSKFFSELNRFVEYHLANSNRIILFHFIPLDFPVFESSESRLPGFRNLILKF